MQVRGRLCRCEGDYAGVRATMQVRGRLCRCEGDYAGARATMRVRRRLCGYDAAVPWRGRRRLANNLSQFDHHRLTCMMYPC